MYVNVLEYLEQSAAKFPDKTVFADETKSVTYSQLKSQAEQIGTYIAEKFQVRNQPVAVLIDRNVESLILFMGVVASGNFYVPVDMGLPEERIKNMLLTLDPAAVLGLEEQREAIKEYGYELEAYPQLLQTEACPKLLAQIRRTAIDTDPLYAIFTSGSTGVPKAVLVAHRSVIDLVECFKTTFEFSETDVFGNQAPFDFDVSVKDIYSTLKNGATMEVIPKQLFSFPVKLIEYLNERKISNVIWATTALCIVANLRAMKKVQPLYLKNAMFSGEVMPIKVLNYWREHLPQVNYVNLYGPTEITCNCTYYKVDRDYQLGEVLPIGEAFRNTDILVLNESDRLTETEEIGELCVRGSSLALGYYNNWEKTTEVFCQNPLNRMYPERIYRTGDLVKYDQNGQLVYCARKDFQIKHMGHRIELGEIEVAVDAISQVERCCCLYNEKKERILLVYQSAEKMDDVILKRLNEKLPRYMVPTQLVWMEEIPLNKNSKIDRVLLKDVLLK